jgi:hypothetical protein
MLDIFALFVQEAREIPVIRGYQDFLEDLGASPPRRGGDRAFRLYLLPRLIDREAAYFGASKGYRFNPLRGYSLDDLRPKG